VIGPSFGRPAHRGPRTSGTPFYGSPWSAELTTPLDCIPRSFACNIKRHCLPVTRREAVPACASVAVTTSAAASRRMTGTRPCDVGRWHNPCRKPQRTPSPGPTCARCSSDVTRDRASAWPNCRSLCATHRPKSPRCRPIPAPIHRSGPGDLKPGRDRANVIETRHPCRCDVGRASAEHPCPWRAHWSRAKYCKLQIVVYKPVPGYGSPPSTAGRCEDTGVETRDLSSSGRELLATLPGRRPLAKSLRRRTRLTAIWPFAVKRALFPRSVPATYRAGGAG
jgi:hypothetical protein